MESDLQDKDEEEYIVIALCLQAYLASLQWIYAALGGRQGGNSKNAVLVFEVVDIIQTEHAECVLWVETG